MAITVAHVLVSCGKMNEIEASLLSDGALKIYYTFLWPNPGSDTLTHWTPRDLLVASEYVEHREDYGKAERGFRHVLYQRGCLPPRYPVPALNSVPLKDYGNGQISFSGLLVFADDLFWDENTPLFKATN